MYAPRFLFSMTAALVVFAIATYAMGDSLTGTLVKTALCAILIQLGYFVTTLFLVWKEAKARQKAGLGTGASAAMEHGKHESDTVSPVSAQTQHPSQF